MQKSQIRGYIKAKIYGLNHHITSVCLPINNYLKFLQSFNKDESLAAFGMRGFDSLCGLSCFFNLRSWRRERWPGSSSIRWDLIKGHQASSAQLNISVNRRWRSWRWRPWRRRRWRTLILFSIRRKRWKWLWRRSSQHSELINKTIVAIELCN